jgi:hypothetical protein
MKSGAVLDNVFLDRKLNTGHDAFFEGEQGTWDSYDRLK